MKDYESYVKKVDRHLTDLRAKYLGQDTRFDTILPQEANRWNNEEKADHLTCLLLFSLAKTEPLFLLQYLDVAILHLLNCRGMNAGEEEFLHHVPQI